MQYVQAQISNTVQIIRNFIKFFFLKGCYNVAHNSFQLTLMMENEANCINEKSRRKESTLNCFPGYKFINDAIKTSIKWFSANFKRHTIKRLVSIQEI